MGVLITSLKDFTHKNSYFIFSYEMAFIYRGLKIFGQLRPSKMSDFFQRCPNISNTVRIFPKLSEYFHPPVGLEFNTSS